MASIPNTPTPDPATGYDQIFLADNEWDSHLMRQVAEEWFKNHPACNFVNVYEHAGWSLGFHRSGVCNYSANHEAQFAPDTPRPTHYTGRSHRRPVTRPDLKEITDLAQYATPFLAELAREMDFTAEEIEQLQTV
jgi:hypothetical protein